MLIKSAGLIATSRVEADLSGRGIWSAESQPVAFIVFKRFGVLNVSIAVINMLLYMYRIGLVSRRVRTNNCTYTRTSRTYSSIVDFHSLSAIDRISLQFT